MRKKEVMDEKQGNKWKTSNRFVQKTTFRENVENLHFYLFMIDCLFKIVLLNFECGGEGRQQIE